MKGQGITKVNEYDPLVTMNVFIKFNGNRDNSVWTKWRTNCQTWKHG